MPVSSQKFREALSRFASGVTVVTTRDANGKPHGLTVSAFCSVSLDPPLILVCIDNAFSSYAAFEESGAFVVSILGEDQQEVSERFAAPHPDRFDGVPHTANGNGIPVIGGALAILECLLQKVVDAGDHTIFIGLVERAVTSDGNPLLYCQGDYSRLDS